MEKKRKSREDCRRETVELQDYVDSQCGLQFTGKKWRDIDGFDQFGYDAEGLDRFGMTYSEFLLERGLPVKKKKVHSYDDVIDWFPEEGGIDTLENNLLQRRIKEGNESVDLFHFKELDRLEELD